MAVCDACKELANKDKSAPGHANLKLDKSVDLGRMSMGQAKGFVHHYTCAACGTKISVDTDKHDKGAGWWIVKEGP
jgi:hypothetical protein